jgi:phospholipid/cholesterol/gamma-HCH transport system substrate-binding protein
VEAASADITEMAASLKEASENVRLSSESFLKTTETVHDTSLTAHDTVEKVHGMVERAEKATGGLRKFRLPEVSATLEATYLPDPDRTWSNIGIDIGYGEDRSALVGLADVGETDRFNFQLGRGLGPRTRLRYGIVESEIGVGWDCGLNAGSGLTVDLFDPNNVTANLLGYHRLGGPDSDWDLVFGVRRLFEDNYWGIGARTRR